MGDRNTGVRIKTIVIASALLLGLSARTSHAQTVASNLDELRFKVKAGDTVYVTEETGPEQEARILDLSTSLLTLSIDGARRDLTVGRVKQIRQRLPDPLWNGAAIGAAVSLGAGAAVSAVLASGGSEDFCGSCLAIGVAYYGGIGALVGMGVDAWIKGRKTIYAAPTGKLSARFLVRPVLLSPTKSLNILVQF